MLGLFPLLSLTRRSLSVALFQLISRAITIITMHSADFYRPWFTDKSLRRSVHSPVKFRSAATVKIYHREMQGHPITTDFTRSSVTRSFLLKAAEICMLVIRNREGVRVKNFYSLTEKILWVTLNDSDSVLSLLLQWLLIFKISFEKNLRENKKNVFCLTHIYKYFKYNFSYLNRAHDKIILQILL